MDAIQYLAISSLVFALAALGLARSFVSAMSADRLGLWLLITISMLVTPVLIVAGLVVLLQRDLIGLGPVIALIPLGAMAFVLGSVAETTFGEVASPALRVAGWSLLVAPVFLVLSVFLPFPLLLVFFIHPRWEQARELDPSSSGLIIASRSR